VPRGVVVTALFRRLQRPAGRHRPAATRTPAPLVILASYGPKSDPWGGAPLFPPFYAERNVRS
jgi:hypothetical protein